MSSSTRDVHPVHDLDGQRFEAPGPVTAAAMTQFALNESKDVDP